MCGEFDWQTPGQVAQQVATNLMGSLTVTKQVPVSHHYQLYHNYPYYNTVEVLPLLKEGEGRLVQVTTTATAHPWPGLSVYTATKAAIEAFRWETVT